MPRLSVYRSSKHIYAQIINDETGKTLLASSDKEVKAGKATKTETAMKVGGAIAKKAIAKKINKVVFDRGRSRYHGRVKALAEGARSGGLKF